MRDGNVYRQVNRSYRTQYEHLMSSGLAETLFAQKLLIPHREVDVPALDSSNADRVLQPDQVSFISYPYEWSFGMLQDAARLTLTIAELALAHGMVLKDASAYNIQFHHCRPIFIDTLSFELYQEGQPWVAYRQFCQHFLAPLAIMAYRDIRLQRLLREHLDGIPLDLAASLLPSRTKLHLGLASHIHLHAAGQRRYADKPVPVSRYRLSKARLLGLLTNLRMTIDGLRWTPAGTEWADYYNQTNYSDASIGDKERLVRDFLRRTDARTVWDLGANNGRFSRLASQDGRQTVAMDIDPAAIEQLYREQQVKPDPNLLPLVMDLTNPSPGLGWMHRERQSLLDRGPADAVLVLALVHHLAIGNNTPWSAMIDLFARVGRHVLVEFVPKGDSQVKRLLAGRIDVFDQYSPEAFEHAASSIFTIVRRDPIPGSERTLYHLEHRP